MKYWQYDLTIPAFTNVTELTLPDVNLLKDSFKSFLTHLEV